MIANNLVPESNNKVKHCPKCNEQFVCNAVGCWCCELPQVMPLDPNAECYCPQCLIDAIVEKVDLVI